MTHRFDPTSLREYDIRGIVGKTLGMEDAKAIGRTFGTMIRRAGGIKVATGYDGRVSSPMLEAGVIEGLNEAGVDAVSVGLGPTPDRQSVVVGKECVSTCGYRWSPYQ